jgi:hypothetical protein
MHRLKAAKVGFSFSKRSDKNRSSRLLDLRNSSPPIAPKMDIAVKKCSEIKTNRIDGTVLSE